MSIPTKVIKLISYSAKCVILSTIATSAFAKTGSIKTEKDITEYIVSAFNPLLFTQFPTGTKFENVHVDDFQLKAETADVKLLGQPIYSKMNPVYVGQSTLINQSTEPQNLTSSAFSKTVSSTMSTSTSLGWSTTLAVETSGKIGIPFVAEGGIKVTVSGSVNGNTTETQSTSDAVTYTASPQVIKVPPNTEARVTAFLSLAKATGRYQITQAASAQNVKVFYTAILPGNVKHNHVITASLIDLLDNARATLPLIDGLNLNYAYPLTLSLVAQGSYEAVAASQYIVDVSFYNLNTKKLTGSYKLTIPKAQLKRTSNNITNTGARFW